MNGGVELLNFDSARSGWFFVGAPHRRMRGGPIGSVWVSLSGWMRARALDCDAITIAMRCQPASVNSGPDPVRPPRPHPRRSKGLGGRPGLTMEGNSCS